MRTPKSKRFWWQKKVSLACLLLAFGLSAQQNLVYQCPMDPDIRSNVEGTCSRCGMKLKAGIPEPEEFPLELKMQPRAIHAGEKVELSLGVHDPHNARLIEHFEVVHEKLFHLFVVSSDLQFFRHDHPERGADGRFHYTMEFPRSGMYRLLGDFYPEGATPQLSAKTVIVPGPPQVRPVLLRDFGPKQAENMRISLVTEPAQPTPGVKTMMFFKVEPADGLEKYLGAWGHMLAASDDLVDMIHTHPFLADGGPNLQFNVYFPRARAYRVWVQFQRRGVVNTAYFDVPVRPLE